MSKAQTDIRSTSYDVVYANPLGYVGTIDDTLAQIRAEDIAPRRSGNSERRELLHYLGVPKTQSAGPSVEMDENPRYGDDLSTEPTFYSLAYALKHFPGSFVHRTPWERFTALSESQRQLLYAYRRDSEITIAEALARVEAYPNLVSWDVQS